MSQYARWFYDIEPNSRFVVQEHLRQAFWFAGAGTLWIEVTRAEEPFEAVGYWNDVKFTLEWERARRLTLRAPRRLPEIEKVLTLLITFEPLATYQRGDEHVTEWVIRSQDRIERLNALHADDTVQNLEEVAPVPA
nr:hypothetical protein [Ardenticatena sp.]